jgi:hypothetical protein
MPKLKNIIRNTANALKGKSLATSAELADVMTQMFFDRTVAQPIRSSLSQPYYEKLHSEDNGYRQNNWLLSEISEIQKVSPAVITELGAGNLKCAIAMSKQGSIVNAVDWVQCINPSELPPGVRFMKKDITFEEIPKSDLCCSADFFEHLAPKSLLSVIENAASSARYGYHKIACYDDGHSHLSVLSPLQWLNLFKQFSSEFYLKRISFRRDNINSPVVTLSNIGF